MPENDFLQRFIIESSGSRGEIVRLTDSYRSVSRHVDYPIEIKKLLGEVMCTATLLTATLKFEGKLSIQLQGQGLVSLLLVQSTHEQKLRATAKWQGEVSGKNFKELIGKAQLAITIEPEQGKRYQGIVPLEGENFAECIELYFLQSEQLPTQIWLAVNQQSCAGFLLQKLPGNEKESSPENWEHITILARTITDQELLEESFETILYRLFHAETVKVFEGKPVVYECTCSKQRFESGMMSLGQSQISEMIKEGKTVDLKCEFCGAHYLLEISDLQRVSVAIAKTSDG
ncbi:Hsp33 family molecular chaperone HslO [bacterium]|nr:Hsp33 family molecular chaperone HslO [bacterium]